ncbi:MAG: histidine kinase [Chitinophagaceae bacterium]
MPFIVCLNINQALVPPLTGKKIAHSLISLACIILVCEGNRLLIYHSYRWTKVNRNALIRILYCCSLGLLYTTIILSLSTLAHRAITTGKIVTHVEINMHVYINERELVLNAFTYALWNAVIHFGFLLGAYELLYRYAYLRNAEKEKEKLEKEKLRAELNQLKGIINPHFLFNNLNSLSSLISDNPAQAEIFLDELTKVFRYLLRNNDTELTTLAQEMQFIHSYYRLLQTRYGSGIHLQVDIDPQHETMMLPPLTLQLLIENAAKHNQLNKNNPLSILLLSMDGNKLMVRNTICKKDGHIESTGIGLQNINARYKMLKQPGLIVKQNEKHFDVILPLVQVQEYKAVSS